MAGEGEAGGAGSTSAKEVDQKQKEASIMAGAGQAGGAGSTSAKEVEQEQMEASSMAGAGSAGGASSSSTASTAPGWGERTAEHMRAMRDFVKNLDTL